MGKKLLAFGISLGICIFGAAEPVFAHSSSTPALKEVALTFDDGPYGTSTVAVLNILREENVHGTFFLIGKNVEKYPDIARLIVEGGNVVGNHTYDHPKNLPGLSLPEITAELSKTDAAIASSTGVHTRLFRPPYGNMTKKLRRELRGEGYRVLLWNVDPKDWNYASSTSDRIVQHVLNHLKKRMIVVLHDGRDIQVGYPRDNLINALPALIEDLKREGYIFVTADGLSKP